MQDAQVTKSLLTLNYRPVKHMENIPKRQVIQYLSSTLDKQRVCVNTQLKSPKKQLKLNVCVPKSNSNGQYATTCDVIAYYLVHFISIWVIDKCQPGIDFFY